MGRRVIFTVLLAVAFLSHAFAQSPRYMPDPVMGQQLTAMFAGGGALGLDNFLANLYYKTRHSGYRNFANTGVSGAMIQRTLNLKELTNQPNMASDIDSAYVSRELVDGAAGVVGLERAMDISGDYSRLKGELDRMQSLVSKIRLFGGSDEEYEEWQSKHDDYEDAAGRMHGTGFSADKLMPNQLRKTAFGALYRDVTADCRTLISSLLYWKYRRDVTDARNVRLSYRLTPARKTSAGNSAFVEWLNVAKNTKISAGSRPGGRVEQQ